MHTDTAVAADIALLHHLNEEYIRSVQESDVGWFDTFLADDFCCSNSDGTLSGRAEFLQHTALPAEFTQLAAHDVVIRRMGDFAIIHARTTFTKLDGKPGASRYTDVWARQDRQWRAVSAHITRY